MTYDSWQEALAGLVKREGLEGTELGWIAEQAAKDENCRYWLGIYEDPEKRALRRPPYGP